MDIDALRENLRKQTATLIAVTVDPCFQQDTELTRIICELTSGDIGSDYQLFERRAHSPCDRGYFLYKSTNVENMSEADAFTCEEGGRVWSRRRSS